MPLKQLLVLFTGFTLLAACAMQDEMKDGGAKTLPSSFAATIEGVAPAVVKIYTATNTDYKEIGSGFVISPEGHIVTNHHLIHDKDADRIYDLFHVTFYDKTVRTATVVGTDPHTDLALLKVETDKPLYAVDFEDSDSIRVGDWVVVLGNPLNVGHSASVGIVSALARDLGKPYVDFLQIAALLHQGNSGGPVFNMAGKVVGVFKGWPIADIIPTNGGDVAINAWGIELAIPASLANEVVAELRENGSVKRARLDMDTKPILLHMAHRFGQPKGLYDPSLVNAEIITWVAPGGLAEKAGLRKDDIIGKIDGEAVDNLRRMIASRNPGEEVRLTVGRAGEDQEEGQEFEVIVRTLPLENK